MPLGDVMGAVFFPDSESMVEILEAGKVSRKIKARGGALMMVEVSFAAGGRGAEHAHPHEQATYCLSGRFRFTVEGDTKTLEPGDTVYVPSGARHGTVCEMAGALLDVFTPQREDFLKG
jgi:quercetin dioxygenase-like cupin family protein